MKIGIDELSNSVEKILSEYTDEVKKEADLIAKETATKTAEELKVTSPKNKGKYARGWSVKAVSGRMSNNYVVHNKKYYRLTHLLENGHVIRNKSGTYGRTRAIPHIEPAEEKGINEFKKKIVSRLGGK